MIAAIGKLGERRSSGRFEAGCVDSECAQLGDEALLPSLGLVRVLLPVVTGSSLISAVAWVDGGSGWS